MFSVSLRSRRWRVTHLCGENSVKLRSDSLYTTVWHPLSASEASDVLMTSERWHGSGWCLGDLVLVLSLGWLLAQGAQGCSFVIKQDWTRQSRRLLPALTWEPLIRNTEVWTVSRARHWLCSNSSLEAVIKTQRRLACPQRSFPS